MLELFYLSHVTVLIEIFLGACSFSRVSLWKRLQQFHHLLKDRDYQRKVVVRFGVVLILLGREEEVSRYHLVYHACKRPNISSLIVEYSQDHFWRPVLSRLNFGLEVVVGPTGVTEICDLQFEVPHVFVWVVSL